MKRVKRGAVLVLVLVIVAIAGGGRTVSWMLSLF